ncbi:MAG: type I DNA topoisomerase [Nitrospirales bacterium]
MVKSLIIVESPAKARTIGKYLGRTYTVVASVGHLKDLPKSKFGVDVDQDFSPDYVVIRGKAKVLSDIKKKAKEADKVFLATDPDREGEAIAWHIAEEVNGKKGRVFRVLFNEITQASIKRALQSPGNINIKKVEAQQARRILDRIVGYKLSPLLWEKVQRRLSAGRVQSVAVRLICEREREREAFRPEEYWSITATLQGSNPPPFEARLVDIGGKEASIPNGEEAQAIVDNLRGASFTVSTVEKREKRRNPLPPFITSRLQQEAARKLRFTPKKTMTIAQQLYEGVELGKEGPLGLITYMRTDSPRVAGEALTEARAFILERYNSDYLPENPNVYKTQKAAQEAHEAIRPTSVHRDPESIKRYLERDQYLLYRLIWNRFLSSQMTPAILEATRVDIQANGHLFRANGTVVKFPGHTILYAEGKDVADAAAGPAAKPSQDTESDESRQLPTLTEGEALSLVETEGAGIQSKQHFTQPPPRYNEALLIKELEEKGIGRPSTYASIISTIQDRQYVQKEEGRLRPTELGVMVNERLVQYFPDVFDVEFTARLEEELDEIEEGEKNWVDTVREFYTPFMRDLGEAEQKMEGLKGKEEPTDLVCEKCGRNMVIKWGRHGHFLACPGYPECKNTKEFTKDESGKVRIVERQAEATDEKCEKCGSPMVVKTGRFGRFLACSAYPDCKTTKPLAVGVKCPVPACGGDLVQKRTKKGRPFYSCSRYPKCDFALWERPVNKPCPSCQAPFLVEKSSKQTGATVQCRNEECGYREAS